MAHDFLQQQRRGPAIEQQVVDADHKEVRGLVQLDQRGAQQRWPGERESLLPIGLEEAIEALSLVLSRQAAPVEPSKLEGYVAKHDL